LLLLEWELGKECKDGNGKESGWRKSCVSGSFCLCFWTGHRQSWAVQWPVLQSAGLCLLLVVGWTLSLSLLLTTVSLGSLASPHFPPLTPYSPRSTFMINQFFLNYIFCDFVHSFFDFFSSKIKKRKFKLISKHCSLSIQFKAIVHSVQSIINL